jgi:hypothetical protein
MSEYNVAGVSRLDGQLKVRFATAIEYAEKLAKAGNVDIKLLEAPNAMTREELTEWLKTTSIYEDPEAKAVIDEKSDKFTGANKVVKVKVPKAAKVAKAQEVTVTTVEPTVTTPEVTETTSDDVVANLMALANVAV